MSGSKAIAEAFGYTAEELKSLPEEANLGLSCGNPTAIAKLKEVCSSINVLGETVTVSPPS